jgi:hypothetical protein
MKNVSRTALLASIAGSLLATAAQAQILVYDNNSRNSYALEAAERVRPGEVTRAIAGDFATLLAAGGWEIVVMDHPSTAPTGGLDPLVDWVNSGEKAILSTWAFQYTPQLFDAFGVAGGVSFSSSGQTLSSTGTATADAVFDGVPMPHSAWDNGWGSDGSSLIHLGDTEDLAELTSVADPVMTITGDGNALASIVIDEWSTAGRDDAVQLWENMINVVLGGGAECRVDLDGDGSLTLFDFLAFQNAFDSGDLIADFDGDGSLTLFDFLAFQNEFDAGCE